MFSEKPSFKFSKAEHLCSLKTLDLVFETGKKINVNPFRFVWIERATTDNVKLKIAFSVPKKFFKRAVDRNKIKRHMREAYRLNRDKQLSEITNSGKQFAAMLVFSAREPLSYAETEAKIILTLQRFAKEACKN